MAKISRNNNLAVETTSKSGLSRRTGCSPDHWQAARWLGMTLEPLEQNYGHHHPDFQGEVATAFSGKRERPLADSKRGYRFGLESGRSATHIPRIDNFLFCAVVTAR